MTPLQIRRKIFIWALEKYLTYLSLSPHISANMMMRAIVELCDNYVTIHPDKRFILARNLSIASRRISERVDENNF